MSTPPRQRTPGRVRTALPLAAALLLGVCLTVAAAWACAYHNPHTPVPGNVSHNGPAMLHGGIVEFAQSSVGPGSTFIAVFPWRGAEMALPAGATLELNQEHLPGWSILAPLEGDWRRSTPPELGQVQIFEMGHGWPWRALVSRASFDQGTKRWTTAGWGLPSTQASPVPKLLPMEVFWPGFLACSALYSLPISGPVLAKVLVRARRRRRGWCIRCGYDLSGSPAGCPECGSGREGQNSALV